MIDGEALALLAAAAAGGALEADIALGAAFGALALSGDLASSFAKRRLDLPAGRESVLLDTLPESLLPLLALRLRPP
jgi:CDP-2,3-bis-(O-geranylgeranyl)-sn-glycerol synthase